MKLKTLSLEDKLKVLDRKDAEASMSAVCAELDIYKVKISILLFWLETEFFGL